MMNTSTELSASILDTDQKKRATTVLYSGLKFLHWNLFSVLFVVPLLILPIHLHEYFFSHQEIKTYEEFRTALSEARTAREIRKLVHEIRLRSGGSDHKKERGVIEDRIEFDSFGFMDTVRDYFTSLDEYGRYSNRPIIFSLLTPSIYFVYFLICIANYVLWGRIGFFPWKV